MFNYNVWWGCKQKKERKTTNMANVICGYIQGCKISRNGWIYNILVIHAADALIKKSSRLI